MTYERIKRKQARCWFKHQQGNGVFAVAITLLVLNLQVPQIAVLSLPGIHARGFVPSSTLITLR